LLVLVGTLIFGGIVVPFPGTLVSFVLLLSFNLFKSSSTYYYLF